MVTLAQELRMAPQEDLSAQTTIYRKPDNYEIVLCLYYVGGYGLND